MTFVIGKVIFNESDFKYYFTSDLNGIAKRAKIEIAGLNTGCLKIVDDGKAYYMSELWCTQQC